MTNKFAMVIWLVHICQPRLCNHLQNVGATTYKNFLQLYAKSACKKQAVAVASKKHNSDGKATPAGSELARSRKVPTGDTIPIEWMFFLYTKVCKKTDTAEKICPINLMWTFYIPPDAVRCI